MAEVMKSMSPRTRFIVRQLGLYLLIATVILTGDIVISRRSFARAEEIYNERYEAAVAALRAENEALKAMPLSEDGRRIELANSIARMLYGIKDNNSADLRTACWCVFNRVDCPEFPNSIDEVIEQPGQWMQYSPCNPVLDELYEIARDELDSYLDGDRRPCDSSYVFMDWSPDEVSLRNEFNTTRATKYWRAR